MALYRLYCEVRDGYGGVNYTRVGKTFGCLHKCLDAAAKASLRYATAVEVKDDSRSIFDRLLEVYRDGRPVGGRFIS